MSNHPFFIKLSVIIALFFLPFFAFADLSEANIRDKGSFTQYDNIRITSYDGTKLSANLRRPKVELAADEQALFPTIIFVTSWTMPVFEYFPIANRLANNGYQVITYVPRGWFASEGIINVNSSEDTKDMQSVLDWVIDEQQANPDAIAAIGVSYGAGIPLLAATQDERIRTVVSLSGWADLEQALAPNMQLRGDWSFVLDSTSRITGKPSSEIAENLQNIREIESLDELFEWSGQRSPIFYWDKVNQRRNPMPLFVSNNVSDYLFHPSNTIPLVKQHRGPIQFRIDDGTHGATEVLTQIFPFSRLWNDINLWFDHYLKGEQNGIQCIAPINWKVYSDSGFKRESLNSFDDIDQEQTWYLTPDENNTGSLSDTSYQGDDIQWKLSTITPEITSGFILQQVVGHFPVQIDDINTDNAFVFTSETLESDLNLRGEAEVSFPIDPEFKAQYFAYLLELDPQTQRAKWISHGGQGIIPREGGMDVTSFTSTNIKMRWMNYRVSAGKQLVLVIDGSDTGYYTHSAQPQTSNIKFLASQPATIKIPSISTPQEEFRLTNAIKRNCQDDNPSEFQLGTIITKKASGPSTGGNSNNSGLSVNSGGGGHTSIWLLMICSLLSLRLFRKRQC